MKAVADSAMHPLRASAAEQAPAPSLEAIARDRLLNLTVALAFIHVVLAFGHVLNPAGWDLRSPLSMLQNTPWSRIPAWVMASASAFFLFVLRLLLPRLPLRWAFPLGELVCALVALNALGWFTLGVTPEKTVPLAFAILGSGFLLFTSRGLVIVIAIALGGWICFAREAGFTAGWHYFGGVLAASCVMSVVFQRLHLQTIRQMLRSAAAPANAAVEEVAPPKSADQDEHFRRWYEATFEGIALHEKGVILETNRALATLLHCELSILPGQNLLDWFTRASRNLIEESVLLGNFRPFEAVVLRPDKTELHVELFTKRVSFSGKEVMVTAFRDITERQRAAAALTAEQVRLQQQYRRQLALAELAVDTGETTEVARILECIAETAATVLPLRAGACVFVHENDQFALAASHLPSVPAGFDPLSQLARVSDWIRENRETFVASDITREDPFEAHKPVEFVSAYVGVPLLDGDKLVGILFILETEEPRQFKPEEMDFINELANRATVAIAKAQLYAQLNEANRVLQKQSALLLVRNEHLMQAKAVADAASDAKSEYLAKVSQELRTPINAVVGMTEYLLTTPLNTDQRESAYTVRASAQRLLAQIDDIVVFSKLENGSFASQQVDFSLHECLRELIVKGKTLLERKPVIISLELSENLPSRVRGDRVTLNQLLWHLLQNAIQFTSRGEIILGAACSESPRSKGTVVFTIRDTGCGIATAEASHLSNPSSQPENSFAGLRKDPGLGLSTTKRMIERLHGHITVQSELHKGSIFTIYLPLEMAETPAAVAS